MSRKRKPISTHDRELFRDAVKDVLPLNQDKVFPFQQYLAPIPRQRERDESLVIQEMMSDVFEPTELEIGEELLYLQPGLPKRLLRYLRQGKFSINAELDLHGLNVAEARYALTKFLGECDKNEIRSVRIIHGKGQGSYRKEPVLKRKVNTWLQQRNNVLAFCSARSVDGGTGAIYVLLKRSK